MIIALLASPALATTYTWNYGSDNWDNTARWDSTPDGYPDTPGDTADITRDLGGAGGPRSVTVNVTNATVGTLLIGPDNGNNGWGVVGSNQLILDSGTTNRAVIVHDGGSWYSSVSAPLLLKSDLTITVNSGRLPVTGDITSTNGLKTITQTAGRVERRGSTIVDRWTIESGELWPTEADTLDGVTVEIRSGGTLRSNESREAWHFRGATFHMNGGVVNVDRGAHRASFGGDFLILSNTTFRVAWGAGNGYYTISTFGKLDFGPGNPTLSVLNSTSNDYGRAIFVDSVINNSGRIETENTDGDAHARLEGAGIAAGATVTKRGGGTLQVAGTVGARFRGNADLISSTNFTLIDCQVGNVDYQSPTYDNADSMWVYNNPADNVNLTATLTASTKKATVQAGGPSRTINPPENAGYVTVDGLRPGKEYFWQMIVTSNVVGVATSISNNPSFSEIEISGENTVRFRFTSNITGTGYFGWDNSAATRLGADVVKIGHVPMGTVLFVK